MQHDLVHDPFFFEPGDRVRSRAEPDLLGTVRSRSGSLTVAWDDGLLVQEEPEEVSLAEDVVVGLAASSHDFCAPDGYWGRWHVRVRACGRAYLHRTCFGKAGDRSSVPDRRADAEDLVRAVRAAGYDRWHFAASPLWSEEARLPRGSSPARTCSACGAQDVEVCCSTASYTNNSHNKPTYQAYCGPHYPQPIDRTYYPQG